MHLGLLVAQGIFVHRFHNADSCLRASCWLHADDTTHGLDAAARCLAPTAVEVLARKRLRAEGVHIGRVGDVTKAGASVAFLSECVVLLQEFQTLVQHRRDTRRWSVDD
jgi:hypothetical protein